MIFQKGTLIWRDRIKCIHRIPRPLEPSVGAFINWICGITVFLGIGRIGVFGLGYNNLGEMLLGKLTGVQSVILLVAKLLATIAVYAWGGAGGIFSPTLFFGATVGLRPEPIFLVS